MKLLAWQQHSLAAQPERRVLEQQTGLNLRRTNRFTELLIGGALACLKNHLTALPHDTALIVCSQHGALTDCKTAIRQVMADNTPPMPFTLMNTQHNMALLHLANALNIQPTQALLIGATPSAFANTLWLSQLYLDSTTTQTVLIGFVDEDNDTHAGECSFFYVTKDSSAPPNTWQLQCEIKMVAHALTLTDKTLVPAAIWPTLASSQHQLEQYYPLSATQQWQLTLQKTV
jgi:hypothetical protein